MTRTLLFATMLAALPGTMTAQAHPLVGNWTLSLPVGMRVENDEPTPIMGRGSLTVAAVGDSLIATMTTEPMEGRPRRPAARMAARLTTGRIVFSYTSTATLNMNGEESTRKSTSTYTLEATGDALAGTVLRQIEGLEEQMGSPQPLTGTRAK